MADTMTAKQWHTEFNALKSKCPRIVLRERDLKSNELIAKISEHHCDPRLILSRPGCEIYMTMSEAKQLACFINAITSGDE